MANPLISVVIPTRDRPDTLAVTLRSLRLQTSQEIEIVVQDNGTNPATRRVASAAGKQDGRIRYVRSPHQTSQRQSFEYALSSARGDYMGIIGDDDSYCAGALDWLAGRLRLHAVDAVRWSLLFYVWPSLSADGEGFFNLSAERCFGGSAIVAAAPLARRAALAATAGSWDNILVYHGLISRRVYDNMRMRAGGQFFAYPMPDVYAHNLLPHFCDRILQVNDFISIYGMSGHSAGASWTRAMEKDEPGANEGKRWMEESRTDPVAAAQPWHPDIRTLRYHDYAALKRAEGLGLLPDGLVDKGPWIKAIISEIRSSPWQIKDWFESTEQAPYDSEIFAAVRKRFITQSRQPQHLPPHKHSPDVKQNSMRVIAVDPSLNDDVEGACLAAATLTGSHPERYDRPPQAASSSHWWQSHLARSPVGALVYSRPWERIPFPDLNARMALQEKLDRCNAGKSSFSSVSP